MSEWVKPHPDTGVVAWLAKVDEDRVFLEHRDTVGFESNGRPHNPCRALCPLLLRQPVVVQNKEGHFLCTSAKSIRKWRGRSEPLYSKPIARRMFGRFNENPGRRGVVKMSPKLLISNGVRRFSPNR